MRCGEHENDLNQCHYTVYRNQLAQTCSVGYSANVQWLDLSSCGTLSEPLGGYISYGTSSGTKATAALTCFYGYLPLNSHNKRECPVESTSWTADPFTCIPQICDTAPSVRGASSTIVMTEPPDGAFTINTTIIYTCPDNTTQTSKCEYASIGRAQWVGNLQDCTIIVDPPSSQSGGDDRNIIIIGILIPVILITLIAVIVLTIGVIIVAKRRPKASDKVHFQSSNDAVTIDGFENPMSKDPSTVANPLYLKEEAFEEDTALPDDGTV
ncbi:uncharacterized protein [Dysidea avara]|uniref:uncharacterized protein n=1 Tax=Dysidea avara TaxID=196820 RepID=UPI00331CA3F1